MRTNKRKHWPWLFAGLLGSMMAPAAWAEFNYFHSTDTSFSWRGDDGSIGLNAVKGGVQVDRLKPEALWGLRVGDLIETVDGRPLSGVPMLLTRLSDKAAGPLRLGVRRAGVVTSVVVAVADYAKLSVPPAPAPPVVAPPPPPPPPAPAAPEDGDAGSGFRYLRIDDDLVSWRGDGQRLLLVADAQGIGVDKLAPTSLWGLRQGDRLVSLNGQPLNELPQLLRLLRALDHADARLGVVRAGKATTVLVRGADYWHLLDPH